MTTPNIEAARTELGTLLDRRARRTRYATALGCLLVGALLLLWPVVVSGAVVLAVGLFGGLVAIIWGLVVGLGVVRPTGQRSRYQHDRITYLQAVTAAHDAAAAMPTWARGSQPKSRTPLPPTVDSKPNARRPTVETVDTLERW